MRAREILTVVLPAAVALALPVVTDAQGARPAVVDPTSEVFVNEVHYDNAGTDAGEAIEIAGPAGTNLSGWSIVLYNGNGGAVYNTLALSGSIPDQDDGVGTLSFGYPANGIQNGNPDGIALVSPTGLEQFLSYGGTFTAVGGPADGQLSTDIGVTEPNTTPVGQSLQLTGTGTTYGDFTWQPPAAHSFGLINPGQTFTGDVPSAPFVNEVHYDNAGTDAGEAIEIAGPAGTNLSGWSIVLYNGNGGAVYDTDALSGSIPDQSGGFGTVVLTYPSNGIQNGNPDGIALVSPTGLEQFLSYGGTFTGVGGPADGQLSTDIGVAEAGTTPAGQSLQLTGTGTTYGDFTWQPPAAHSFGLINPGQTFAVVGPPEPIATCPAAVATPTGTATSAEVSATDEDSTIDSIAITSPAVDGITLTPTGVGTATLGVAATTAAGTYDVVIEFATDDDPPQTTTCTVSVSVLDVTLISTVQSDPVLLDDPVRVEGVVTSLFTDNDALDGFFVQEEDADGDGNAATSEGLFVDCTGRCPAGLASGDVVQVIGIVTESFGRTGLQADVGVGAVSVLGHGAPLPTAVEVDLPAPSRTNLAATFEAIEGMITVLPDTLAVSEYFQLARFGQLVLTVDERPFQFTHLNPPSVAGNNAHVADLATRRIFLDDDNDDENDAIVDGPDEPYPYPGGGLSLTNRFRGGDTIEGLTGVMDWSFNAWRIRPLPDADYTFESANPAPATPEDVGGDVKVSAFNVLNSFDTIDTTPNNAGPCGPSGTLDCRGADSDAELVRQRTKIVAALAEIDADVFGFMEIQNDEGQTADSIVAALNAVPGAGPYAAIDTGFIGTDAIKVALIYKPASVEPVGDFVILDSTDDPDFIDTRSRPALIQTFEQVGTDERFTVAVNHFKSKGSSCDITTDDPSLPDDPDLGDGQGNCPLTRTLAAQALAEFLATDPTDSGDPDFLIIGDLNAYRRETPITTLIGAGYNDLIEQSLGDDAYSFVFDGQLGYLDHALATDSLEQQVTEATEWKINSDEVPLFDYNDELADAGEAAFERESAALPLYAPTPARSSDHDPLIVGLDLPANRLEIDEALITVGRRGGGTLLVAGDTDARLTACPVLDLRVEGAQVLQGAATTRVGSSTVCVSLTNRGLFTYNFATGEFAALLDLPSSFTLTDRVVRFELGVNGDQYVTDRNGRRLGPIWIAD
jgi:predicted extracellular nuclease